MTYVDPYQENVISKLVQVLDILSPDEDSIKVVDSESSDMNSNGHPGQAGFGTGYRDRLMSTHSNTSDPGHLSKWRRRV